MLVLTKSNDVAEQVCEAPLAGFAEGVAKFVHQGITTGVGSFAVIAATTVTVAVATVTSAIVVTVSVIISVSVSALVSVPAGRVIVTCSSVAALTSVLVTSLVVVTGRVVVSATHVLLGVQGLSVGGNVLGLHVATLGGLHVLHLDGHALLVHLLLVVDGLAVLVHVDGLLVVHLLLGLGLSGSGTGSGRGTSSGGGASSGGSTASGTTGRRRTSGTTGGGSGGRGTTSGSDVLHALLGVSTLLHHVRTRGHSAGRLLCSSRGGRGTVDRQRTHVEVLGCVVLVASAGAHKCGLAGTSARGKVQTIGKVVRFRVGERAATVVTADDAAQDIAIGSVLTEASVKVTLLEEGVDILL